VLLFLSPYGPGLNLLHREVAIFKRLAVGFSLMLINVNRVLKVDPRKSGRMASQSAHAFPNTAMVFSTKCHLICKDPILFGEATISSSTLHQMARRLKANVFLPARSKSGKWFLVMFLNGRG